jgi:translation initiation factor IF-3
VNRQIRAREVLLIDAEGEKRGVVAIQDALRIAEDAGLDLVEVASTVVPPVCKVMDYGKMEYQQRKRSASTKSHLDMKEINFSMKIGPHDIETKLKKAREFLGKGHKLRINLVLRGRERSYADTKGLEQLRRLIELLGDLVIVEQQSKGMIGNRLFAILTPNKKPASAGDKGGGGGSKSSKPNPSAPEGGKQVATAIRAAVKSTSTEAASKSESEVPTPG